MSDKDNVVKALKVCLKPGSCRGCPYHRVYDTSIEKCSKEMMQDALELIESQDKLISELKIKVTLLDETLTGVTAAWADTLRGIDRV